MSESDGADELIGGMGRVAVTGLGVVAENAIRRRADADRGRAEAERARAGEDRARTAALLDVDRADPRRRATEEVTAVAVLRADDRRREEPGAAVNRLAHEAADQGDGPRPETPHPDPVRQAAIEASRAAYRAQQAGADTERAPRVTLDPETAGAKDVAARSFASAASAAVRGAEPSPKAQAPRARTQGRSPERDRGR